MILSARPAVAAAEDEQLAITTSLITPFFGAFYLEADLRASNVLGVLLNASYLTLDEADWTTETVTLGAGLLYHWQGTALRGWYVEASSELLFSSWSHVPSSETAPIELGFSVTAVAGHRFVCDFGPVLDVALGLVVLHFPSADLATDDGMLSSPELTRFYPALKLGVGWAF